ncbi:uncharacterized protein GGS25DRAFT_534497 [Hypoxylon fragiforme]|uniref:uncharacterized protein n=1 Tax=Hypoxylon fragiforme TaxID=63214 RepID=UPI0020C5C091|nr:uncharacterized protein GGS25DRAFT_534497 [Hypoxylon fragiforme]KAI2603957.1 hypothetical protein GGS25DRAFT_534497 [Hypoxylon fragiforme]
MGVSKEKEAQDEALPAYEELAGPSSSSSHAVSPAAGPTVASPFNFPSDSNLPSYETTQAEQQQQQQQQQLLQRRESQPRVIAIPQITPHETSPLLNAYSPTLLQYGVPEDSWLAFLRTLSGFLAATVSQKAVSHAADMAQHVGGVPKRFGKETLAHAKDVGHAIRGSARRGNFLAAAAHTLTATVTLPVGTALRAVGAAVSLPFAALGAAARDPKTPRERAVAYAAAANVKWFHRRGLEAHLVDTTELCQVLGLSVDVLLSAAEAAKGLGAAGQLAALGGHIAELEVKARGPAATTALELGAATYWLVVSRKSEVEEEGYGKQKYAN